MSLSLEVAATESLPPALLGLISELCSEAYAEDFAGIMDDVGPGVHLLGWLDSVLVSHVMWVTRWLEPQGQQRLRTAYIEAVATRPSHQHCGFASELLARIPLEVADFDLAALSPSTEAFYERLGWETWRGPLFIRKGDQLEPTPDETVMVLRLPRTPRDLDLTAALSAEWRLGEVW